MILMAGIHPIADVAWDEFGRLGIAKALNRFAIDWCGARLGPDALGGP